MTQLKTTALHLRGSFPASLASCQGSGEPGPEGQPVAQASCRPPRCPTSPRSLNLPPLTAHRAAAFLPRERPRLGLCGSAPAQKTLTQVNTGDGEQRALGLTPSCVPVSKLLYLSVPQFSRKMREVVLAPKAHRGRTEMCGGSLWWSWLIAQ